MSSVPKRRFLEEYSRMLQKPVTVKTSSERIYSGTLLGFDSDSLSICLGDVKDEKGTVQHRIFLNGNIVEYVATTEKPFDLQGLASRLEKVFPHLVKVHEDAGVIVVMDKIRVSEEGIIEGSGPASDRVRRVIDEFLREGKG